MAKFIQLTEVTTQRKLYVNINELSYFIQQNNYCSLVFKGAVQHVKENTDEILALIEKAITTN